MLLHNTFEFGPNDAAQQGPYAHLPISSEVLDEIISHLRGSYDTHFDTIYLIEFQDP